MTSREIEKKNSRADQLKVIQSDEGKIFVENTPKLKEGFLKSISGKDFVLYAGVLDLAQQKGLSRLEVSLIQFPTKENGQEAICLAVAEGEDGELFSDIGDANPQNCSEMIGKHLIRMASTRAKGRALRDMCNIGIACLEELESAEDVNDSTGFRNPSEKPTIDKAKNESSQPVKGKGQGNSAVKIEKDSKSVKKACSKKSPAAEQEKVAPLMSEAQKRAIYNLSRRRGMSVEALELLVNEDYSSTLESLSSADASTLIRNLQKAA